MPTLGYPPARKVFDYSSLDAKTAEFIQQQTGEIKGLVKRTAQSIVEIGVKLINVKDKLEHGQFGDWLRAEFEWSHQTAKRFMNVAVSFRNQQFVDLVAPSALYLLAAPSTPAVVREEAITRAQAGESITYSIVKSIKQKYTESQKKLDLNSASPPETIESPEVLVLKSQPEVKKLILPPQPGTKQEIIAIRPQPQAMAAAAISQPAVTTIEQPGVWWQLGGKHLLYCGNPNSDEFLEQVSEDVHLLLAFPPAKVWRTRIISDAQIVLSDYLPMFQNPDMLDEALEVMILSYSQMGDTVVVCFLPSPDILSIISRFDRRGLLAEPDSRRCSAIAADWKRAGMKVERVI